MTGFELNTEAACLGFALVCVDDVLSPSTGSQTGILFPPQYLTLSSEVECTQCGNVAQPFLKWHAGEGKSILTAEIKLESRRTVPKPNLVSDSSRTKSEQVKAAGQGFF